MGAIYRVQQGMASFRAAMRPEDRALADRYLSTLERPLFERMSAADQRHSVGVLRALLAMGVADESLLKAALLHDVGKSRCRISVVHRTLAVLLSALFGGLSSILPSRSEGGPWLPLYVLANHGRIGASMLARAGEPERVWRLAELHHLEPRLVGEISDGDWVRQALVALRRADNQN